MGATVIKAAQAVGIEEKPEQKKPVRKHAIDVGERRPVACSMLRLQLKSIDGS